MLIANDKCGYVPQSVPKRNHISGTYTATAPGPHTLEFYNYRNASEEKLWNHIDDISLVPQNPDFFIEDANIPISGGSAQLTLDAGPAHAGQNYLVLASFASHPGLMLDGILIPLNTGFLFNYSLSQRNSAMFQNTEGVLDSQGQATAVFDTQGAVDPKYLGVPIVFSYVLLDGQTQRPVKYASFPGLVNIIP